MYRTKLNCGNWPADGDHSEVITWSTWTAQDRKAPQQVIKTTQNVIGTHLQSISDISKVRCLHRDQRILNNNTHPSHILLTLCKQKKTSCNPSNSCWGIPGDIPILIDYICTYIGVSALNMWTSIWRKACFFFCFFLYLKWSQRLSYRNNSIVLNFKEQHCRHLFERHC